jgi:hypothetical protein
MKTISPTAAADTPPLPEKPEPPITPPPLEPEEKPIIVRDHGVDTDEEHDIDTAAGDEGSDDEEKGEFTDPSAAD